MYVYAIYNQANKKLYIGQTSNIEQRFIAHNQKRGNHFTAKFHGEWKLIYSESFITRSEALRREKQLKSFRGREFLKKYIPVP
jgi:putative endonuclease